MADLAVVQEPTPVGVDRQHYEGRDAQRLGEMRHRRAARHDPLARSINSKIHPDVGRLKLYIEKFRQQAAGNDIVRQNASSEVQSGFENGANPRL